jgi:hypothetical protein
VTLWVTIPSGTRRKYLQQIIHNCDVPLSRIVLVNTADNEPTQYVHNLWSDELNIQTWWNMGIDFAVKHGADHVAVLNDDLQLLDNPLNKIVAGMGDAAIGQPNIDSICGYCFILNTKYGLRADESYRWWYGDNDLYDRASQYGIAKVGVDVRHLHGNEQTSADPVLLALGDADRVLYESRQR